MKRIACLLLIGLCPMISTADSYQTEKPHQKIIRQITPELIQIRRHIHQNPEMGNREFKTAALVAEKLRELGIEIQEKVAHTGVVGILHGRKPGRTVAVRADMDALPLQEKTDLPFKSQVEGVMHACGHDIHTTIGLGTAMVLAASKDRWNGTGSPGGPLS
jgi:amidohydrolase